MNEKRHFSQKNSICLLKTDDTAMSKMRFVSDRQVNDVNS